MKRSELKEIMKECLEELFEENDFFMRLLTESIQATISATLKESLSVVQQNVVKEHTVKQSSGGSFNNIIKKQPKYIDERGKFNPREFLGSEAIDEFGDKLAEIVKEEKTGITEHVKTVELIDKKIPDSEIFGEDMGEFFAKVKNVYKGGKK